LILSFPLFKNIFPFSRSPRSLTSSLFSPWLLTSFTLDLPSLLRLDYPFIRIVLPWTPPFSNGAIVPVRLDIPSLVPRFMRDGTQLITYAICTALWYARRFFYNFLVSFSFCDYILILYFRDLLSIFSCPKLTHSSL